MIKFVIKKNDPKEKPQKEPKKKIYYCKICNKPTYNKGLCNKCIEKLEEGDLNITPSNNKQDSIPYNQHITIEHKEPEKEGCFTKGCMGTLGIGCGIFILIAFIIFVVICYINKLFF